MHKSIFEILKYELAETLLGFTGERNLTVTCVSQ